MVRGIAQPLRRETEDLIGNLCVEAIDDSGDLGGVRYKRQMRPVLLKRRDGIYDLPCRLWTPALGRAK